jgi:hypothetical protein
VGFGCAGIPGYFHCRTAISVPISRTRRPDSSFSRPLATTSSPPFPAAACRPTAEADAAPAVFNPLRHLCAATPSPLPLHADLSVPSRVATEWTSNVSAAAVHSPQADDDVEGGRRGQEDGDPTAGMVPPPAARRIPTTGRIPTEELSVHRHELRRVARADLPLARGTVAFTTVSRQTKHVHALRERGSAGH